MARFSIIWFLGAALVASPTASAAAPEQYRFTYRPLDVGDQATDTIRFALDLKTILSQRGELINATDQTVERKEHVVVARLPAGAGESAKARVKFETSEQTTTDRGGGVHGQERPVASKTYVAVRRREELIVTDEQGNTPPEDELKIVARTMDGLGKPNPLGAFFDRKTVAIGQSVRLPLEFTQTLLSGWDEDLARLPLDVVLMGTQRVDGQLCALFHTPPAAAGASGAGRPPIQGKFLIEIETCRAALVELSGPVATNEKRGTGADEFDVRRKGKLQVAVHVTHKRR
ncbi:MAG: hypothetical protein HYX69_15955 [Planctomycetia bacterium]|nr:hypothetical protein [Planctomycetia bacterium]